MSVKYLTRAARWPLMRDNLAREDREAVCELMRQEDPILTQASNVRAFEGEWSRWLGVRHSVFVNSGSSANLLTLAALRELYGPGGRVIVPTVTWVSDIASVLHCGFEPVFVDIDPRTLGMDNGQVLERLTADTRAVFLTHVLGYNGLTRRLLDELGRRDVLLLEDVCESHGATFDGRRLGTYGLASNFSFYYAHHLSTIEGGMVCTNNTDFYETVRMLRSHGLVRELDSESRKKEYADDYPDLSPEFIFAHAGYNVRSTEINAVIGRSQLRRLDDGVQRRTENLRLFLDNLDGRAYHTDFATEGSSNYAFTLVLREPDADLCRRVMAALRANGVEFRRGTSGGGNQLRQPYLRRRYGEGEWQKYPNAEHLHFYGFYIGNYPSLERERILWLCELLNGVACGLALAS
jgi:CDP-6-deoxy-D-xylo-4-hexulose-3-dehydrase